MRCPNCKSNRFIVDVTIRQEWLVNGDGKFLSVTDDHGIDMDKVIKNLPKICDKCGTIVRPRIGYNRKAS